VPGLQLADPVKVGNIAGQALGTGAILVSASGSAAAVAFAVGVQVQGVDL
jgi:hypothetical protein